jgi:hypothetical protein
MKTNTCENMDPKTLTYFLIYTIDLDYVTLETKSIVLRRPLLVDEYRTIVKSV